MLQRRPRSSQEPRQATFRQRAGLEQSPQSSVVGNPPAADLATAHAHVASSENERTEDFQLEFWLQEFLLSEIPCVCVRACVCVCVCVFRFLLFSPAPAQGDC